MARQRGPISGQLQRKQRKHRTFLTLFLYTILKYLFIKILCFRCSWLINGVIKPFVAAQNLHKTGTELHRTPARRRNTPSPIPPIAPKVAPKRATQPPRHGLTAQNLFSVKPKKKTRPIHPQPQSGKSVFFCGRKQPGASRSGAQRARKGRRPCTEGVQNRRFWHAFGDFRRETKVTRGAGRSARIVPAGSTSPAQTPGTWGAAPTNRGYAGAPRPCTIPLRCRKIPP